MAGKKTITNLSELTSAASNDVVPVVDVSDQSVTSSGETKKITVTNLLSSKADSSHTHAISDVTNLQTSLDAKQAAVIAGDGLSFSGDTLNAEVTQAELDAKQSAPSEGAFVDGDKTKLDGIEASATADQTGAEIKAAYEGEADTNAFTDADHTKLDGIETGATADQTASEIKTAYESNSDTNAFTDADHSKLDGIEASATADQTGAEIKSLYEAESDTNAFTDADHTKLDGIAAGAIANVSEDTTPQLGGNLDVNGQDIVSTSNSDIEIAPNGTGKTVFKGNTNAGKITLNCENNSHGVSLASPAHADYSGSWTLTLPTSAGSNGQVLTTNGSGVASWAAGSSVSDLNDLSDVNAGSPSDGQVLKWNNSASEWQAMADNNSGGGGGGGTPAGSTGQLQFNDGGSFGADSDLYWDSSAEGLGIGGITDFSSSGANAKLAVNAGFINVDDDYGLVFGGGTGRPAIQGSKANGDIYITNANLGIGTSSPSYPLTIANGTPEVALQDTSSGGSFRLKLDGVGASVNNYSSNGDLTFGTTGTGNFIFNTGKLGVGSTSPTGLVHLSGDFGTTETEGLYISNGGTASANDVSPIAFTTRSSGWGTQHAATIAAGTTSTADGGAYLTFKTSTTGQYAPTERMRIQSDGTVHLPSSSNNTLLKIDGNSATTKGIRIQSENAGGVIYAANPSIAALRFGVTADDSSITTGLAIDNQARVAIGSGHTSPSFNTGGGLHIKDTSRANLKIETGSSACEQFVDGNDFYLDHYPSGSIVFRNDTRTERMRIASDGALTSTSTSADAVFLKSSHANNTNVYITNTNATTSNTANLWFAPANDVSGAKISAIATEDFSAEANRSADLALSTRNNGNWVEAMRIDSSGLVGIGSASPSSYYSNANDLVLASNGHTGITIKTGTAYTGWLVFADGTASGDNTRGGISYDHNNNNMKFRVNNDAKVTIDSSGNLGVGTTSPSSPNSVSKCLHIHDSDHCSLVMSDDSATWEIVSNLGLTFRDGTDTRLTIDSSGNVKVGNGSTITASTDADDLVIDKGAADTGLSILSTTTGRIYFGDAANNDAGSIRYVHSDDSMRFETDDTEQMRIQSDGAITGGGLKLNGGILGHKDSDASSITLVGGSSSANSGANITLGGTSGSATREVIFKSNATETMRIDSSGNVGIGTTAPDHSLTINGGSSTDVLHLNSTAPILKVTATNNASGLRVNAVGLTSGHLFRVQKDATTKFEIDSYSVTRLFGQLDVAGGSGTSTNRLNISYNASNGVAEIAPDSNSGHTELKFSTCLSGTKSEAMRVDNTGRVTVKKSSNAEVTALTDGATITPDLNDANNFSVTLGGNRTLANPSNCTAGQSGIITITQDGTGSRTLNYGSYWKFSGGTAPTLTTTASAVDVLAYYVESATRITATLISDTK